MTRKAFIEIVKDKGFTTSQAEKCLEVYTKLKCYTINAHDDMRLKHGAFLDKEVIERAIINN